MNDIASPERVAVCALLTSFNRRDKTVACLRALADSIGVDHVDLRAVLVDDGSSDGTADVVRATFAWVEVLVDDGSLYWCRGMHRAQVAAERQPFDHLLWLNDDTVLAADALAGLLACADRLLRQTGEPSIVVGSTVDPATGAPTYGGHRRPSGLRRAHTELVVPTAEAQPCDTFTGNVVLVPARVAAQVGRLDPGFEHAMGDMDYGLRARHLGVGLWVAPGIQGTCADNPRAGTWADETLPLRRRWRGVLGTKGLPIRSWLRYTRRHAGVMWPLYFSLALCQACRHRSAAGHPSSSVVQMTALRHPLPIVLGTTTTVRVAMAGDRRVALVTNIPAPYRVPVYDLLAAMPGIALKLFFCSARESDRRWDVPVLRSEHVMLRGRVLRWRGRYIHVNPHVGAALREFRPHVVVTTGFNPTHLLAFLHAHREGAAHIAMTDGTAVSESRLTGVHRWVRRQVYRRTAAFVGASDGSFALYRSHGIPDAAMFWSPLCADNEAFAREPAVERDVDLIFSGRFVPGKLPLFAIAVAAEVARRLERRVRLLLLGAGELEPDMRRAAADVQTLVDVEFAGFVAQGALPRCYARARVALFPTTFDPWGVVANEACAAGLPVLVSPQAGAAGDLVVDGDNGHVLPLELGPWSAAAAALLDDKARWRRMSGRSLARVQAHTYAHAARGLAAAIDHALSTDVRAGRVPR